MILPYLFRLVLLCFASFFVLNALLSFVIHLLSRTAIRFAETKQPASAARFLFALRLLPFALSALFVAGLCVPSYLWLEPAATSEHVGLACVLVGLLGASAWSISLTKASASLVASLRHTRICAEAGTQTRLPGQSRPVIVLEVEAPILAVSGLLRSRLLISRGLLAALSPEELDAALRHEHSHHSSRDNAKRFLLLLAPGVFPFVHPLRLLDRAWSKSAEWAADDQAVAGDSLRALSLAAALVRVAAIGGSPRLPVLSTALLAGDMDLAARVDRLLHAAPVPPLTTSASRLWLRAAGVFSVAALVVLLLATPTLNAVHELLEFLLH